MSAARKGAKVVLIQDIPVLGGNSSSEIRMWVRGAKGKYNRESGILAEFEEENIYRNSTLAPTLWDSVLFGKKYNALSDKVRYYPSYNVGLLYAVFM